MSPSVSVGSEQKSPQRLANRFGAIFVRRSAASGWSAFPCRIPKPLNLIFGLHPLRSPRQRRKLSGASNNRTFEAGGDRGCKLKQTCQSDSTIRAGGLA